MRQFIAWGNPVREQLPLQILHSIDHFIRRQDGVHQLQKVDPRTDVVQFRLAQHDACMGLPCGRQLDEVGIEGGKNAAL